MEAWEYLTVTWTLERTDVDVRTASGRAKLPQSAIAECKLNGWDFYNVYEHKIRVYNGDPDADVTRTVWSNIDPDEATRFDVFLNDLGREGWEMVSETVAANAIYPLYGHSDAAQEIWKTFRFKRPVADPDSAR